MKNLLLKKLMMTAAFLMGVIYISFSQIKVDQNNSVIVGKMPVGGIIEADPSAKFEITLEQGQKLGFLKPRMIESDMMAIQNPAHGLEVFNITQNTTYYWNSYEWVPYFGASYNGPITYLTAGNNVTITGNGTMNNAYVISSTASSNIYLEGSTNIVVTGTGTQSDPYIIQTDALNIDWTSIINMPEGFADGVDDVIDPNAWHLDGNADPIENKLGTTTDDPVRIITNDEERIRIAENGFVGIGVSDPTQDLHVEGRMLMQYPGDKINNVIGSAAGNPSMTGSGNNFFGTKAGNLNTSGWGNNFMGYHAGKSNTSGYNNNYYGVNAGQNNNTGAFNNFFGLNAGSSSKTSFNNYFGYLAGKDNIFGQYNNYFGHSAGLNTSGSNNVAMGQEAGRDINGDHNISIGHLSGAEATGSASLMLGAQAGQLSAGNGVFLGNHAGSQETGQNKLYISNSNTPTPLIYGEFDDEKVRINGSLEVSERSGAELIGAAYGANGKLVETDLITDNIQLANSQNYITAAQIPNVNIQEGAGIDITGSGIDLDPYIISAENDFDAGTDVDIYSGVSGGNQTISFIDPEGNFMSSFIEGEGIDISINGNFMEISSAEVDPFAWKLDGNNLGQEKDLGTMSAHDLPIITAGTEKMRIETSGRITTKFGANQQENFVVGSSAGNSSMTGSNNVFLGANTGTDNSSGKENVYIGRQAGSDVVSGNRNVFLGYRAGHGTGNVDENFQFYAFKSYNNYIGFQTGHNALEGRHNNYIGVQAGAGSSTIQNTGHTNNFIGYRAGRLNSTGDLNNFIGVEAGYNNGNGTHNIYIGNYSGVNATSNSGTPPNVNNTFIGDYSGYLFDHGQQNLMLGYQTDFSMDDLYHSAAIGSHGVVNQSNKIYLHTNDSENGVIQGDVDFSEPSDSRFKSFVNENVPGLDMVLGLRPVNYKFDYRNYISHLTQLMPDTARQTRLAGLENSTINSKNRIGFIAQEVHDLANSLNYDFGGLYKPNSDNPTSHYAISYSKFVVPLVKATQEQQVIIDDLKAMNENQQIKINEHQFTIDDLKVIAEDQQLTIDDNKTEIKLLRDMVKDLITRIEILENQ